MNVFIFKPLAESDIDLLYRWLNQPHVLEYWPERLSLEQVRSKYLKHISSNFIFPFIVHYNNKSIAYIQYYHADKIDDGWWPDAQPGEVGLDLFIGEPDYLNKGLGTVMLKEFIELIRHDPKAKTLFLDPKPDNLAAIRCYEKTGFIKQKEINAPSGKIMLMTYRLQKK